MFGDLLSGALVLIGILFLIMGITGSYQQLTQFGLTFPGAVSGEGAVNISASSANSSAATSGNAQTGSTSTSTPAPALPRIMPV